MKNVENIFSDSCKKMSKSGDQRGVPPTPLPPRGGGGGRDTDPSAAACTEALTGVPRGPQGGPQGGPPGGSPRGSPGPVWLFFVKSGT